jgi:uncharacterized protein (TIGR03790 family)
MMSSGRIFGSLLFTAILVCGCQTPQTNVVLPGSVKKIRLNVNETEGTEDSKRVLVVCNIDSKDSIDLTEYYARKRKVPPQNIVQISVANTEEIGKRTFERNILAPIEEAIRKLAPKQRIDFILLTKGIPLRIDSSTGHSVDSMIAGSPMKDMAPAEPDVAPSEDEILRVRNPYFGMSEPFDSEKYDMYLVTRLDGFTLEDAKRMVERSVKAKPEKGLFFFDRSPGRDQSPEAAESSGWLQLRMEKSAGLLRSQGMETQVEVTKTFLNPGKKLMGYVSWGSNDDSFDRDAYQTLQFHSGAIAETFVSTSARTFIPTSSGQSLIGDLIAAGVTGVKGYVSEPWTVALCRPDMLMDRYTKGWTLAESFYCSSQMIKWKDVVIGDPICRAYPLQKVDARLTPARP